MAADSTCAGKDDHLEAQKSDDGDGEVRALESTACSLEHVGDVAEQDEDENDDEDADEDVENGAPDWPATASENEEEPRHLLPQTQGQHDLEVEEDRGGISAAEADEGLTSKLVEETEEHFDGEGVDGEEADDEEVDGEEAAEEELEDEGMWEEGEEEQAEEEGDFDDEADEYCDEEGAWEEGEEEEDQWEDEVEEEAWESEPQKAPSQQVELAKKAWDEKWPTIEKSEAEPARQWGNRRNRGIATQEKVPVAPSKTTAPAGGLKEEPGKQAREQLRRPNTQAAKRRSDEGAVDDEISLVELQKENRQLRLELGQAMYKVKSLGTLRDQAAEAQRKEMLARQKEARAIKELELAKEYVGKRDQFARSEKAELMQKVKQLEDTLAAISGREDGLKEELAEATMYRSEAAQLVEESEKTIEKYKNQAIEHAKNVKSLEQKLHQLEEQRQQDKSRLRELAQLVRGQPQENRADSDNPDLKVPVRATAKRSGSKPPERKGSKKPSDTSDGKAEEPSQEINDADFIFDDNRSRFSLAGVQSGLNTVWQCSLKPLVLGSGASSAGGCSGAPGRGKGKKAGRDAKSSSKAGAMSKDLYNSAVDEEGRRQNLIVLGLVVLIACLAVFKTYFNGTNEDVRS